MKRDLLSNLLAFAVGAGIGSAVTYKVVKTKYDQLIQEEIDSVKEAFSRRDTDEEKVTEHETEEEPEEEDLETAQNVINQNGYVTESTEKEVEEEEEEDMDKPYVISPDEFGESDYTSITLWYYTDGVVCNDAGKIVTNTEELIGKDFADHFGEFEEDPDAVYVRNDDQKIDYEILKEYRAYLES